MDITFLGVPTENVRRFAPKRVPVDTNQAAGWAGGLGVALRVSQYTMAGRVGGCERRRRCYLEFGVDSADCSVQSAGSLLWWRTSEVGDVWRQPYVRHDAERTTTEGELNYCFVQRCLVQDGK